MSKRLSAILIVVIFIFTMIPFINYENVYAYTNSSYFNDLKVGLVSMSSSNITITLKGDYSVNGQAYPSGSILNLSMDGTNIILNGASQSEINLVPGSSVNLAVITVGSITNKYMGAFIFKIINSKITPINIIGMEDYLKGVVGYEMSDYFPIEALKAQAVAARNYALSRIGYESSKGYDFDDTINYQVYKGYNESYTKVISAVNETKGQVLLYNEKLVETLYSAWHGGVSENSENVWGNYIPYLRSVNDTYENDAWPNGDRIFTNAQVQTTLRNKGYIAQTDTFLTLDLNSISKFASGRIANINIVYKDSLGLQKIKSVTKDNARTFLSLPSNLYQVTYDSVSGSYTFSGKGYGHGLGMSQIGAKNRAAAGQTFQDILKFYYQNSYIQNIIFKATLSNLTQSRNSLYVGENISFNSTAYNGNGQGYLYKYIIKNGSNIIFTKDYSSESNLDFVPSSSGNYTIEAYVKDKFSIYEYDDKKTASFVAYNSPILNGFTVDKTNTLVGEAVNLSVDMQSGTGYYLYKYEVTKDNAIVEVKDFSAEKQFTYTPNTSGTYMVTVYVKDSISTKEYDFKKIQSLNVYDGLTIDLIKDSENVSLGNTVDFSALPLGGSGGEITYKYVVRRHGQIVHTRDFENNNKFSYVPTEEGYYEVEVYAKDSAFQNEFDGKDVINFNVYTLTITNVNITGSFYPGKILNFNTISIGGSSIDTKYKYEIYGNNILLATSSFNNLSTFSFTPLAAGNYTVKVYLKDGLSINAYDSIKQFDIMISSNPLYLSKLPLEYGATNTDVTSLQRSLKDLGYSIFDKSGYFGKGTKNAVLAFQKSNKLIRDGIVGKQTYAALNNALILKQGTKSVDY